MRDVLSGDGWRHIRPCFSLAGFVSLSACLREAPPAGIRLPDRMSITTSFIHFFGLIGLTRQDQYIALSFVFVLASPWVGAVMPSTISMTIVSVVVIALVLSSVSRMASPPINVIDVVEPIIWVGC